MEFNFTNLECLARQKPNPQTVRTSRTRFVYFAFVSFLIFASMGHFAQAEVRGPSDGGGGDSYAQEFTLRAYDVLERVSRRREPIVSFRALLEAVQKTKVNSTDEQLRDRTGRVVEALNFPDTNEPRILINRTAWNAIRNDAIKSQLLVFHEYLGIMQIDDSSYQVSRLLFEKSICDRSQAVRVAIEQAVNLDCSRIRPEDLDRLRQLWVRHTDVIGIGDFELLSSLKNLTLGDLGRPLREVSPVALSGIRQLQTLEFIGGVQLVRSNAFSGLGSQAKLSFNQMPKNAAIEPNAFQGEMSEVRIRASGPIRFEVNSFHGVRVQSLEIHPLALGQRVGAGLFANAAEVKRLAIANHSDEPWIYMDVENGALTSLNGLSELQIAIDQNSVGTHEIQALDKLVRLKIQSQKFDWLNPHVFRTFTQLRFLELGAGEAWSGSQLSSFDRVLSAAGFVCGRTADSRTYQCRRE